MSKARMGLADDSASVKNGYPCPHCNGTGMDAPHTNRWCDFCAGGDATSGSPLSRPTSLEVADQCREMGLKVGDTIIGQEGEGDWWSLASLTLLYLGSRCAVWSVSYRTAKRPEWSVPVERCSWTLSHRTWFKQTALEGVA